MSLREGLSRTTVARLRGNGWSRLLALLLLCAGLFGCGETKSAAGTTVRFHRQDGVLLPFPSNLYTVAASTVTGLRPALSEHIPAEDRLYNLYSDLAGALSHLDGFGTGAPILIGFSGPLDAGSLPGEEADFAAQISASLATDAPVGIVEAASGERVPFYWRYARDDHLLALFPAVPLRPRTDYLYFVTDRLRDLRGAAVVADRGFQDLVVEGGSGTGREDHFTTLAEDLARLQRRVEGNLVLVDRFTTQTVTETTMALCRRVRQTYTETVRNVVATGKTTELGRTRPMYEGEWTEYDFRDGNRRLQDRSQPFRKVDLRFYIAVPKDGPQPFPVVLVQHGLGDSREAIFRVADELASAGFAAVAIDAPEHGDRIPQIPDVKGDLGRFRDSLGFWVKRDHADFQVHKIRDIFRQAVVDHQEIRQALANTDPDMLDFDGDGTPELDLRRWYYYGQSMGAIIGTMTVAQSADIEAATLNVGGARLTGYAFYLPLIEMARPVMEAHTGSEGGILRIVSLLQTVMERGDPFNYARLLQRERLPQMPPRDILMQFVYNDGTVPNPMNWELAYQADLPLLLPAPTVPPRQKKTLQLGDGVRANLPDGRTGGFVIYRTITDRQGRVQSATHGNMFGSIEAARQAACFFRSYVDTGVATILPPGQGC